MADELPRDMRDLIIRLDQKVGDGFASINSKLDAMDRRADGHETRLKELEIGFSDREHLKQRFDDAEDKIAEHGANLLRIEATAAAVQKMVVAAWAVFGTTVIAMGAKVIGFI